MKNTGTQASPSANATGTRSSNSAKKALNSSSATCALLIVAAPEQLQVLPELLAQEHGVGDAGERPGDVDRQHVQPGQFRFLVVAEQREVVAEVHESERNQQHHSVADHPRKRAAARGL